MSAKPVSIIFCAHPSIYASLVLAALIDDKRIAVRAVVLSTRVKCANSSALADIMAILRDSGIRYAVYLAWVTGIYWLFGGGWGVASLQRQCKSHRLPVLSTDNINHSNAQAFIRRHINRNHKNFLLTAMFNQKLSIDLLAIEHLCCINLHPGKLPQYRGVDPVLMMLRDQVSDCEITLHKTAVELDSGDILATRAMPVDTNRSLFWHQYRLFELGAAMATQWLGRCCEQAGDTGMLPGQAQQGEVAYYGWPDRSAMPALGKLMGFSDCWQLFSWVKKLK